jgi:Glyoxalase/Bleomycin resistance protein/Dioxygenase superfamily
MLEQLRVVQVAYATTDVRAAARRWHELYGAGPFFVRDDVPTKRVTVDGEEAVFEHSCALGQWGDVMVELVHHHRLAPEALERDMRRGSTGIHHVACFVDDLEEARDQLARGGARVVMDAQTPEVRFLFVDPGPELGHLVELYEQTPYLSALYAQVREASVGWDGSDVVRERA